MQTIDIGNNKTLYMPDYESDRELTQNIVEAKGNEYLLAVRNEDTLSSLDNYSMENMLEAVDETKRIMRSLEVKNPRMPVIGFLIDEVEKRIIKEQESI